VTNCKKTFDGRAAARALPHAPGVYQMRDAGGALLYVGKARDLRKRVASYFSGSAKSAKTQLLLGKVADLQVTITHTERDALLLENNLIKSEKPRYNVLLRDDKSYPYIHLDDTHKFPRLGFHRGERKPAGRFFGPWPGIGSAREALALLKKIFPVRQCEDSYFRNRKRPCLQYQIKRCSAPCVGYISAEDYAEDVRQAVLFLEGKNQSLTGHLGRQMEQAAERMDYENAARCRDRMAMLKRMQQSQFMETAGGDADVLALAAKRGKVCAHFLLIRGGRNVGGKSLLFSERLNAAPEKMHETVLAQAYLGKTVPAEIIVRPSFAGRDVLQAELSRQAGRKVTIRCRPRSGGRRAAWLSMAELNAGQHLASHFHGRSEAMRRVRALAAALQLGGPPKRMECFDVSHTGGGATIASCVAFEDGAPRKSDYRSFTIAGAPAGDDYAALEQALRRQEDALAAAREKAAAARARVQARVLEQSKAARQAEVATMTQDKIRKRLEAALQDLDEEMRRLRLQPDDDAKVGGLPVDSRYIVFIVDTSGSMKQRAWRQAEEQMIAILDAYPKVEGIQIMNDMGQYMFDQYRGRWIPDTPARRKAIVRHFRTWSPYSNSSPVEGILEAIRTYSSRSRKISLYIFGDEFSGPSGQAVIDEVERLNFSGGKGRRRVRIHALGFYTGAGATGQRFAALMRELTYRNGGTFIGL